jgi:hypothetical protein
VNPRAAGCLRRRASWGLRSLGKRPVPLLCSSLPASARSTRLCAPARAPARHHALQPARAHSHAQFKCTRAGAGACTNICARAMLAMHAHAQTLRTCTLHTQARHGSCGGVKEGGASCKRVGCAYFAARHLSGRRARMLARQQRGVAVARANNKKKDVRHAAMRDWVWARTVRPGRSLAYATPPPPPPW